MIQKIKNQNISYKAFTLIEMVIVLIIIWIMLMATVFLSWEQIQKVKDKTVKESILAEMQSRYSRNLWSSSYGWMYDTMEVTFSWWENKIDFKYNARNSNDTDIWNTFTDKFEIKYIAIKNGDDFEEVNSIKLTYTPYKITCTIWDTGNWEEENKKVVFITKVNDSRNYCFEISQKNCRLMEMSESKCDKLEEHAFGKQK